MNNKFGKKRFGTYTYTIIYNKEIFIIETLIIYIVIVIFVYEKFKTNKDFFPSTMYISHCYPIKKLILNE